MENQNQNQNQINQRCLDCGYLISPNGTACTEQDCTKKRDLDAGTIAKEKQKQSNDHDYDDGFVLEINNKEVTPSLSEMLSPDSDGSGDTGGNSDSDGDGCLNPGCLDGDGCLWSLLKFMWKLISWPIRALLWILSAFD